MIDISGKEKSKLTAVTSVISASECVCGVVWVDGWMAEARQAVALPLANMLQHSELRQTQ